MKPICNRQLDHFPSNGRSAVLSINRHKTVIFKLFHTDLVLTSIIISITLHFWYRPVSRACVTDSGFTKCFFLCGSSSSLTSFSPSEFSIVGFKDKNAV